MPDVSCRAYSWFRACDELGLVDLSAVLDGAGVSRETLEDPRQRVSWDVWMELTDRAVAQMDDEAIEATGDAVRADLAGSLARLAPLLTSPAVIIRLGIQYVGPSVYRPVQFTVAELPDGRLRTTVTIPERYREGLAWLRLMAPALRRTPRFMGLPDAVVVVDSLEPRRLVVTITPPSARSWFTRLTRGLRGLWDDTALLEELDFQQRQLSESYRELSHSEMGFRAVLDALPAGVLVHREHRILHTNAALTRLLGGPVESMDQAIPEAHHGAWQEVLAGSGAPKALAIRRSDGSRVPVLAHGISGVHFGRVPAGVVFLLDRSAERTAHALHQAIPDLVMQFEHGRLVSVHAGTDHPRAAEDLAPLIGVPVQELVAPFRHSVLEDEIERGLAAMERVQTHRTQEVVPIASTFLGDKRYEARMMPLGPSDEVLLIVRDVTELTALQEQLTVSERMASVGSLAAGVAHEINNPLTYVSGNLAWALEELGTSVDPAVIGALQDALEGAQRVERIVRQMRDLSRPHPPDPTLVDVGQAVQTATDLVAPELRHAAQLELRLDAAPAAFIDETQLVQVLVNLLLNAAQAIPEDQAGQNAISVHVGTAEAGGPLVRVRDSGIGIPDRVLSRLFEPFFTTKKASGTGLGLAISHRIITAAGGRITARNHPDGGAEFTIELPSTRAEVVRPDPAPPPATRPGRIVVVDDDPPVGRAIVRLLRDHEVTWSGSVDQAIPVIRRDRPDLILCDVMMPDRNGLDLHDAIDAPDRGRLVFLSGGVFSPELAARLQATQRPVLMKPLQPDELRRRVRELLEPGRD